MAGAIQWYAIAFGVGLTALIMRRLVALFGSFAAPRIYVSLLKHVFYPLVIDRQHWPAVTRFHFVLVLLYFSANVAVLFLSTTSLTEIQGRSAALGVINLSPLLYVGYTNALSDCLGLSTTTYLSGHRVIGTISIIHSLVHAAISLRLQSKFSYITYSGLLSSGALLCIIIISLLRIRANLSLWIHELFGFTVLGGILWHLILLPSISVVAKTAVGTAISLCLLTSAIRLCRILFFSSTARVSEVCLDDSGAARFVVSTRTPVRVQPGKFFYVFLSRASRIGFQTYPLMAIPSSRTQSRGNKELMFCVENPPRAIKALQESQRLWIDGPYGSGLHAEAYENLVLVAEGPGILGVLPIALYIADRKCRDSEKSETRAGVEVLESELHQAEAERTKMERDDSRARQVDLAHLRDRIVELRRKATDLQTEKESYNRDLTRRVTILWRLDHNSQARWVGNQMQLLQELDPGHTLVVLWCIFPSPKTEEPPFQTSDYFVCLYPPSLDLRDLLRERLEIEARAPGRLAVISRKSK
ncbi:hypothetical protein GGR57DRAFT_505745 [Xylariaceae sp. FL1272]|nr:hypothetical protein GGR57DRAFT_505745 [Xylariaceae sp. FL1272]